MTNQFSTILPGEPNAAVLFGYPVPDSFFGDEQDPITDITSSSLDVSTASLNSYASNTFYTSLLFYSQTFPLLSPALNGTIDVEALVDRITDYLMSAALRASSIEEKENYELASSLILRALRSDSTADLYLLAFAWKYGTTPERAVEKIEYRRAWMLHSSTNKSALPYPPKKPARSAAPTSLKRTMTNE